MSAYILVDEAPKTCESCVLKDCYDNCLLIDGSEDMDFEEQKENCPIKSFPEERKKSYKPGYKTGYNDGWNDCLDVLRD